MAAEVIVNDGGSPAKILPFVSAATGSAGDPIIIDTAGKTAASTAGVKIAGFLLTDVDTIGDMASVVMGSGCILKVKCIKSTAIGDVLSAGTARLDGNTNNATQEGLDDGVELVGVALEAGDGVTDLPIKVLVL